MASLQRKIVKGREYWSLVESKRINGKPTPIVIEYYGNTKKFAEKLLNGEYNNKILKSFSHGDTFALYKIVQKLEIEKILDNIFKKRTRSGLKRSQSIIIAAIQSACCPGSKNELFDWIQTTTLPYEMGIKANKLTSQHFWSQMDDITEEELDKAEDAIVKKIFELYDFELEKIALDYTNYFTYIDSSNDRNSIAKRGKNKQKRNDLRQYSLALITTKESGLPLYTHVYEGNVNDQSEFFQFVNLLKNRIPNYDPKSITLVFDGGSNNKKNFAMLETHYICSFSLSYCKELYEIDIKDYKELKINGKSVRNYRIPHEIWGKQRECILTFSESLLKGQLKELNNDIQRVVNNIEELNEKLHNPKSRISKSKTNIEAKLNVILCKPHMNAIFKVSPRGSDSITNIEFSIDEAAKLEIINKYFGKKLIVSDRKEWSTFEIIKTYREQDCIEKIFRDSKDTEHFSIRPQYHFTDQKIRVHIFSCLLGLTLATILHKDILNKGFDISKTQLLNDLRQIRQCFIKDKIGLKVNKTFEEMTELQSNLWCALNKI